MHFRAKLTLALIGWSACLPAAAMAAPRFITTLRATIPAHGRKSFLRSESPAPPGARRIFLWFATSLLDRSRSGSSASSKAASWCWKARGNLPPRSALPRASNAWWSEASSTSTRPSCQSCGNRRSKFPSSMCPKTRAFSRPSAGTMRRLRWFCIEARARCYGSPSRPAKKDTNGSLTCCRL